jgi:Arc/MetJ family transcription regulator
MRTNIEIDDKLMKEALKATGLRTKREVVDFALKQTVKLSRQADIKKLRGKFQWEGDLEKMRLD